ncbi:Hth-type transcriptional regulator [Thalictrum thalictroides]|uniref:Hth-type transcriptional regulator n=1 Tax=Thalictrum thalictroides TaxID=46969 RepID=A0A7J6WBB6_THATH|nr:Hth-type transcriptional regulator [Thalictrum thalictroides]
MGICASSKTTRSSREGRRRRGAITWSSTVKVIHLDGRLQEFTEPIKVGHILSKNPSCFLCNSETMYIDSLVPHVPYASELQLGQIYFLMPLSQSSVPLSLTDLCDLAIKAGQALRKNHNDEFSSEKSSKFPNRQVVRSQSAYSQQKCQILPVGLSAMGMLI